jgi:hypothetical protein
MVLCLGLIASIVGGWYVWDTKYSTKGTFQTYCEQEIKDRLRSPATYHRISFEIRTDILSAVRYQKIATDELSYDQSPEIIKFERNSIERTAKGIEAGTAKPYMLFGEIEYDAANAYGTPVRSIAVCEWFARTDSSKMYDFAVKVDGLTHIDYLTQAIKQTD